MIGYIYKTTNKINGKIYVGQKKSERFLGNKYLGSGKVITNAVKHYGNDNFTVEMLEEINSVEDLDNREIYWIKELNATNREIGYNISEGGKVNRTMVGENNPFYGKHHSEKTIKRWSEIRKGLKGYPHKMSEESKIKISIKNKGRIKTIEEIEKRRQTLLSKGGNYWSKNPEYRLKMSILHKGKPSHCKGRITITNNIEEKMIFMEDLDKYLKLGWWRGRKPVLEETHKKHSEARKGRKAFNKNMIWVNNSVEQKFIQKSEQEAYINQNWKLGMLKRVKEVK
ncbi:MAG: NUMOD3 domain-containing DNA-binding protein [Bacilli bacterium]